MIICPECGKENPQGSKFCRNCGINLTHEHKTEQNKEPAKKATVIDTPTQNRTHTHSTAPKTKKDDKDWWLCCICLFFIFLFFAIAGH